MKQVLQNLSSGSTELVDVPCPQLKPGHLLIQSYASLISQGTERMLVSFGKAGWLEKARQQPDKVRMVLEKVKTDGILPTISAVRSKLDRPLPMGYCNVGRVLAVGQGVTGFSVGDLVASNGNHAEIVSVAKNLCAKVPTGLTIDAAAFTVISAIGLQGVRLALPTLGETFVVSGLGLVGLITVQLLRANGCRVLGIDFDASRCALAERFGAVAINLSRGEDPISAALSISRGRGVDGVLITAATTSNQPVQLAARMCRKRGRIILVGVTGLNLSRADFYEKELSFQVSCSYGPGRYDPIYEEKGTDYPVGYVRWTEQRNFEAALDLLHEGKLDVTPLITHRFMIERAAEAYHLLSNQSGSLGILLEYTPSANPEQEALLRSPTVVLPTGADHRTVATTAALGFIGSGNYATQVLIPSFRRSGAALATIASSGGVSGTHAGRKFGFVEATTDTDALLTRTDIAAVVITTRHDSHVQISARALRAGKHVFVEKPLAISDDELTYLRHTLDDLAANGSAPLLMVGFNRRFAPQVTKMKELLKQTDQPKTFIMTVNCGAIPADHWTQDPAIGGGRIVGEACHFIDLLRFLAAAPITGIQTTGFTHGTVTAKPADTATVTLTFGNGSLGTIHYFANGHKSFPKERLEVFCDGRILQLDNFRKLRGYGWPGFTKLNLWQQDKGHDACARAFVQAITSNAPAPIPLDELFEVARVSLVAAEALPR